ncbi:MAG TPA: hypothetical protein VIV60_01955 [Polyangiaceae bacterium]
MTPSEHRAEYALRMMAAPVAAVIAAGVVALVLGLVSLPLQRFDLAAVHYASGALAFFARGFVFVFVGSFVLPGRWRLGGALVLAVLGIALQVYMMRSYTSDPAPPLWPLFTATAGGVTAAAVRYFRRPRSAS